MRTFAATGDGAMCAASASKFIARKKKTAIFHDKKSWYQLRDLNLMTSTYVLFSEPPHTIQALYKIKSCSPPWIFFPAALTITRSAVSPEAALPHTRLYTSVSSFFFFFCFFFFFFLNLVFFPSISHPVTAERRKAEERDRLRERESARERARSQTKSFPSFP